MTQVTFNIDDYVDEERKREIAEDVFKSQCLQKYKEDHERIFGNVSLKVVRSYVDDEMGEDFQELIKKQVIDNIENLSSYTVFSPKFHWERESTGGFEAIKEAVSNNKDMIENRVRELIQELDANDVADQISEAVNEKVFEVLSNGGAKGGES